MSYRSNTVLSIVIPVYNEQDSLRLLYDEIAIVAQDIGVALEILFVDDGSSDKSWSVIRELQLRDGRIAAIRFRRNFGKAAALAAGFAAVHGHVVFTMDADLQDDAKEIPRFLDKLAEGFDLVSGWKRVRNDPWHKTLPSWCFNTMVSWVTGVRLHDHNCGFKAYKREVLRELRLYGEFHRFTPVLAAARGFRVGELTVNHRARQFGASKYGWRRFARGFLDLLTVKFLTSYQNRPQHLLGGMGLFFAFIGVGGLTWLAGTWVLNLFGADLGPIGTRPLLIFSATSLLVGMQMLSLGFIAELVTARNHDASQVYSIAERHLSAAEQLARDEARVTHPDRAVIDFAPSVPGQPTDTDSEARDYNSEENFWK